MYRLADIDFSNALVISSREPMLPDEVDRQDDMLESVWWSELEKAVFRAA